jgi:predicted Zn-dependent protease
LGDAYLRVDKLDQAEQAITRALALDTTITGAFIKMGKVLLRRQDVQTAVMYLQHAEKMDPGDFTTHELLSQAYHRIGRDAEAKQESALASRIHEENQLVLGSGK